MKAKERCTSISSSTERAFAKKPLLALCLCLGSLLVSCRATEQVTIDPNEKDWETQVAELLAGETDQISITASSVIDDQLEKITGNSQLRKLILDQGCITDRSGETLASFKNLLQLRLRESPLTDISMVEIRKLESLMFLNLPQA